ncbi:sulfatase-like hydrolase/transferase [Stieleria maiorica]|uniref:sulfatase-like hydrolase/transferase n=1 Tax=Stieleria maiorica TaxID=2795974 RepID=UPI00142F2DC2|nr:sulfatase-like hydrolase/transferase [Stieleria maiorica]
MNRVNTLVSSTLLLILLTSPLAADAPNVILIMTDDQGYGDLSCHGNPTQKTPHLDHLHSQSVRFTDFHVAPFCTPTRAALMTGRYPARTGAYRTSSGRTSLHRREKTLGNLFTRNGYATGIFGKWHLGDCAPSRPMDKGFERSVWHRCGGLTQISDYWTNDYFDDTYLVGDRWKAFEGYCTDVWFDEAMKFITSVVSDAGGSKPFFVYLPTNAPHGPYLVAPKWKQPFLEMGMNNAKASFKGMVANFDWNLGRLLRFLDDERLADDTVVIFMTDNGTSAGTTFDKGTRIYGWPLDPSENANMRGGKSSAYDGGHRVPLFIRWPNGQLGSPRDIDTLAAHFDITPTLMDLCELDRPASWPSLDGRSLVPLIKSDEASWPPRTLHTQMHGGNGYHKPGDLWEIGAVLTERWRLVEGRELYDIVADPAQRNDVAEAHPDVVGELTKAHEEWFDSVKPGMIPTRILVGSDMENPTHLTSQEWVMPEGSPPWAHGHVLKRMIASGPWYLDVATAGTYVISLSRWPGYLNKPIESKRAAIEIGGQSLSIEIPEPDNMPAANFTVNLPAGPTELTTTLTTLDGQTHGAYFATVKRVEAAGNDQTTLLWTQYCVAGNTLKLSAHTDADPTRPTDSTATLALETDAGWQPVATVDVDSLTAMAAFRIEQWDAKVAKKYRVTCGGSERTGTIRAEPKDNGTLKLMAVACVNDKYFPYEEAVAQMIDQDPDLVFFAGDQIYESNAGGEVVEAKTEADVPRAMANYLAKWRRFGMIFRDLLKDRPSVMITDDHDVYANDLWGDGGRHMTGDRTSGGYPMHPTWVNAAERTQMWHLPDPVAAGPWGDGINAYFTSLDYGGVSFAILEDRKFKSPPSEVLSEAIGDPRTDKPNRTLEVIMDPAFDAGKLDRPDLQLLGQVQEAFLGVWGQRVKQKRLLAAVLSQSPFVNIGNYDVTYGDMDANGWPQSARNRALRAIAPANAVMISGDIHFGTLHRHGIDAWGDGPWGYSLPAFASNQNRSWRPRAPAQGGQIDGVVGSGNHHDRFGNKLTVAGTAHGYNGYGMVLFDNVKRQITLQLHTMDGDRNPSNEPVPGWPLTIDVP